jgi:hypothetical protein
MKKRITDEERIYALQSALISCLDWISYRTEEDCGTGILPCVAQGRDALKISGKVRIP